MWGWRNVERTVHAGVGLNQARQWLTNHGFEVESADDSHATFKRDGTQWTSDGKNMPVELAVAEQNGNLVLHLRYDTFVLFDTGDLEHLADEIAANLQGNAL